MTACETLRPDAAGIAALPARAPERLEYLRHAQGCPDCLRALGEAEAMLRLLDAAPPSAPKLPALQRASQQIISELTWLARQPAVRGFAVAAGWAIIVFLERRRAPDGWLASVALAGAAALIAAFLGALPAVAGAIALAAAFAGFTSRTEGLAPSTGVICVLLEQVCAVFPLAAVFWLARKTGGGAPRALVAAAVSGALAGDAALYLTCPARHATGHVWAFHFSGVVAAALLALAWSAFSSGRSARAPRPPAARA
jgi:hypothetical protein